MNDRPSTVGVDTSPTGAWIPSATCWRLIETGSMAGSGGGVAVGLADTFGDARLVAVGVDRGGGHPAHATEPLAHGPAGPQAAPNRPAGTPPQRRGRRHGGR